MTPRRGETLVSLVLLKNELRIYIQHFYVNEIKYENSHFL